MKHIILALFVFSVSISSYAKIFRNAYISFEMPDSWSCKLEQTEWVCRSDQAKESREAIIILTAKEVGPTDSLAMYDAHLGAPIQALYKTGESGTSKVTYKPKNVQINDLAWIDGLHLGSEVKNYYTRYLATIKDRIAVLVTFSAHQLFYAKYSQDFFKTIKSLKVIATKDLLSKPDLGPLRPGSESLGQGLNNAFPGDMATPDGDVESGNSSSKSDLLIGAGLLLAAIGVYVFLKIRQRRKNS